jgi:shikimate dehydrogenase
MRAGSNRQSQEKTMLEKYSGATRIYFVVGHPIAQVQSPARLTRNFETVGYDAISVPIDILPEDFDDFMKSTAKMKNVHGFCFTIPHKFASLAYCTSITDRSRVLNSVSVARRKADGTWHGDIVEGEATVDSLRSLGCTFKGQKALLIGAGGAGSSIGLALLDAGVEQLAIHDIDVVRRDQLISRLSKHHHNKLIIGSPDPTGCPIVSNGSSAGMKPGEPLPIILDRLAPGSFVSDVVTMADDSPLVKGARQKGCHVSTGVDLFLAVSPIIVDFMRM